MKLTKIKIQNYRCFGEEQIIDFDDLTAFIGNNCSGKTTAMSALNCIFSNNSNDRILNAVILIFHMIRVGTHSIIKNYL